MNKQKTLANSISFSGIGIHTGQKSNITVLPNEINKGISFIQKGEENNVTIKAVSEKVSSTERCTTISQAKANVSTIEHLMAALYANGITNAIIEIDSIEVPILDGSSLDFVKAIEKVGIIEQDFARETLVITEPIFWKDEEKGGEYTLLPADEFSVQVSVDFNAKNISPQSASLNSLSDFNKEIAPARTFCFLHELEYLIDNNLAQGGNKDNAVVLVDEMISEEKAQKLQAFFKTEEKVTSNHQNTLNNTTLRFNNEPARHKLLDIIGDLALVGADIQGKLIVSKPGHSSNVQFAGILRDKLKKQRQTGVIPFYPKDHKEAMTTMDIENMLPHRHPFLLVDKILEIGSNFVVGMKNVTYDEPFFPGHFPKNPVMPGVLQIEAMAQTGGILALSLQDDPSNWDTYFMKIEQAKFKNMVRPGDTLIIKLELLSPVRRGICHMKGTIYVGNQIATEAELLAKIIKR